MDALDDINLTAVEEKIRDVRVRMSVLAGVAMELRYEDDCSAKDVLEMWRRERQKMVDLLTLEDRIISGADR